MKSVLVEEPGFLTTVQDIGRRGFRRFGLTASGPMDREAHGLANWLAGNPADSPGLEITFSGPVLVFDHSGRLALCGADLGARLNDRAIPMNRTRDYRAGDRLTFSGLRRGLRAYLALAGGIDCEPVMGSCSTNLLAGIGGLAGRALQTGDVLPVGRAEETSICREIPPGLLRLPADPPLIRVIAGPEAPLCGRGTIRDFLTYPFQLQSESDRIGLRLQGPGLVLPRGADIISAGIPPGTIQVTGAGRLIITMADGQTTGGYARLAFVLSIDLPRLAQLNPGDFLRFSEIRPEEAENAVKAYRRRMKRFFNWVSY